MPLSDDERNTITRLARRHDAEIPELEQFDMCYEATEPLEYMHPEVAAEVGTRIRPVRVFLAQIAVDSVAERLFVQGIKSGDRDLDAEFRRVWSTNGMDLGMTQAITDALIMRRSYISVGTNEKDPKTPLLRPESPLELYVDIDPRTDAPRAALRRVSDVDPRGSVMARYATLYLPDVTIWCQWDGEWQETNRDEHGVGAVMIAPLVNRPRTRSSTRTSLNTTVERVGRSDVEPVRDVQQGWTKQLTDMMVAGELVAIPLRGVTDTTPQDFVDEQGNPMTPLRAMLGRMLTIPSAQAKALDFAAAQLSNFSTAADSLSKVGGAATGLPPTYLGTTADNPASAEAITASESRLATKAEAKQVSFGLGVRRVAQLIYRLQNGSWSEDLAACRVDWRDVRTPTRAAQADAAMKLGPKDKPITPMRQTREALGYDETEIEAMEEEDEKEAERSPVAQLARASGAGSGAGPAE